MTIRNRMPCFPKSLHHCEVMPAAYTPLCPVVLIRGTENREKKKAQKKASGVEEAKTNGPTTAADAGSVGENGDVVVPDVEVRGAVHLPSACS